MELSLARDITPNNLDISLSYNNRHLTPQTGVFAAVELLFFVPYNSMILCENYYVFQGINI
jgi:hypothetical protein